MKKINLCNFEKISGQNQDRVLRLIEHLREQDEIERRFSRQTTAILCRECRSKTRYSWCNFMNGTLDRPCELCRASDRLVGVCGQWEAKR